MTNIFKGRKKAQDQNSLKFLHPYLYKRVRLKAILFSLLGLSIIFSQVLDKAFRNSPSISHLPNFLTGGIFLFIGLGIAYGLYSHKAFYRIARGFLAAAFIYALFFLFLLVVTVIVGGHVSTSSIVILWGYMTYNLFIILGDSGWQGAALLKEIIKDEAHKEEVRNGSK